MTRAAALVLMTLGTLAHWHSSLHGQTVSFHTQIEPMLTRAGCNAGACHGAAVGRGGLHLSLFGSNPTDDYRALVHELDGRRINLRASDKSLLLRKPLGDLDRSSPRETCHRTAVSWGLA